MCADAAAAPRPPGEASPRKIQEDRRGMPGPRAGGEHLGSSLLHTQLWANRVTFEPSALTVHRNTER